MKLLASTLALSSLTLVAGAVDKVTYADHILPIFRNACLNCHNPDKKKAGLDLSTYQASLMGSDNGQVLQSGNAAGSLLFKCIKGTDDLKMPPKGDKLSDGEIATIEKWIAGQLLETATGVAVVAADNNVQVAAVSLERPPGPAPMPGDLPMEPFVQGTRKTALIALAASPWAPLVAVGGQKQILLYNSETADLLGVLPFPEGFPAIIRFSRNGQILLTGGGLGGKSGKVVLWDIKTGDRIATLGDEFDQVLAADLSPDQQHVALGGPGKILKVYATKDGQLVYAIKKHTDWVTAVAYSPEGKFLASADRNGGIQVWEAKSGKEYNGLPGHKVMVTSLAFMTGVLASSSEDGTVKLWDVKEAKEMRSWAAHPGGAAWVDFCPDGRLVSCGRDKIAKVWDQTGKVLGKTAAFGDIALRAAFNSERVIAGDWTGDIRISTLDGKQVAQLATNPLPLADRLSAANKRLADSEAALKPLEQQLAAAQQLLGTDPVADVAPKPEPTVPVATNNTADLEKRIAAEKNQLQEFRGIRDRATSAERPAAQQTVNAQKVLIAKSEAELIDATKESAPKEQPAPAPPKTNVNADNLAKAKAASDEGMAQVQSAKAEVTKWTRAIAYMNVHKAKSALSAKKAQYEGLVAAAKVALDPVAQNKAEIASSTKAIAEAPAKIADLTGKLTAAQQALDAANKTADAANIAVADKEAAQEKLIADLEAAKASVPELTKKLNQQNAEVTKLAGVAGKAAADSPERTEADAKHQAGKSEATLTETALGVAKTKSTELPPQIEAAKTELPKLKEAVEKARADLKVATVNFVLAEKGLASAKKSLDEITKRVALLKRESAEVLRKAMAAKVKAEKEGAVAAKELESAKANAEQVRATFDKNWLVGK